MTFLVALTLLVLAQDPPAPAAPAMLPAHLARMVRMPFDAVWEGMHGALGRMRLRADRRDRDTGIVVTRWAVRQGLRETDRYQLHVFVSPYELPPRVYVGSIVERARRRRPATNGRSPAEAFPGDAKVVPLRKVHEVAPVYPHNARDAGAQDDVMVVGTILEDGAFIPTKVPNAAATHGELMAMAVGAASLWRFEPTSVGGCHVLTEMTITVSFTLKD